MSTSRLSAPVSGTRLVLARLCLGVLVGILAMENGADSVVAQTEKKSPASSKADKANSNQTGLEGGDSKLVQQPRIPSDNTSNASQTAKEQRLSQQRTTHDAWKYTIKEPPELFPAAPSVPIALEETRPAILLQEPPVPTGAKRRYGLIRYGSAQSIQIALILDDFEGGRFDLYVNSDRDSEITADEIIPGSGNSRQCRLLCDVIVLPPNQASTTPNSAQPNRVQPNQEAAASDTGKPVQPGTKSGKTKEESGTGSVERFVFIKRGVTGKSLSLATLGFLEGHIDLVQTRIRARCLDANGNGLFSDARDRLWLDLNQDGEWDPFQEQFPLQPMLTLSGQRYAIKTNPHQDGFHFAPITGEGLVQFQLSQLAPQAELKEIELTIVGRDGSIFAARTIAEPITLPVGDYALSMVRVVVAEKEGEQTQWEFVFSRTDLNEHSAWYSVKQGQTLLIDPIGKPALRFEGNERNQPVPAGRQLHFRPILVTQDGLLINSGKLGFGSNLQEMSLPVELCRPDGTVIDSARSGFS